MCVDFLVLWECHLPSKRTKNKDLNMVSEAGRCPRAQPDEVDTGVASYQGWTLVTQMLYKTQHAAILFVKLTGKTLWWRQGSWGISPYSQSWGSGKKSWVEK